MMQIIYHIYLINLYDTDNIYNFDAIIYDGSIN